MFWLSTACCRINTNLRYSAKRSTLTHFGDCAVFSLGHVQSLGYTGEAKKYFTNMVVIIIIIICEEALVGGKNQTR